MLTKAFFLFKSQLKNCFFFFFTPFHLLFNQILFYIPMLDFKIWISSFSIYFNFLFYSFGFSVKIKLIVFLKANTIKNM